MSTNKIGKSVGLFCFLIKGKERGQKKMGVMEILKELLAENMEELEEMTESREGRIAILELVIMIIIMLVVMYVLGEPIQ